VDQDLVGLAFGAGLVAVLNPCGFAMLPGYLALVVGGEGVGRRVAVGRALTATAAMACGFLVVFGGFGVLSVSVASTVQQYLPYATLLIGIGLVVVGIWLLIGREFRPLRGLAGGARWAPSAALPSMLGYGISYAIASLSCTVGPFLAVTAAGTRTHSVLHAGAVYAAYAGGFALIVGVLAVAAALATSAVVDRMRRIVPYVNRISGALLVGVGAYVGYYGLYEIRLFAGTGNTGDPVIEAAGRVQGAIAGWVHRHGGWPWLVCLVVLLIAAVGWRANATAKRRRADRATAAGEP
jgi:cytochrome c biogenesis protein CcdA